MTDIFSFKQHLGYLSPRKRIFALYFWKAEIKFGLLKLSAVFLKKIQLLFL